MDGGAVSVERVEHRGWEVVRLSSETLAVDVLPAKGADILQVRWLPAGLDLLWRSPWGLRQRGAVPTAAASDASFLDHYPGGWQTIFPNGGGAVTAFGAEQGFHGEAWLTPFDWTLEDGALCCSARLVRTPFEITKRITVSGARVAVEETVRNAGGEPLEVMWSHHPAFGAPFLDESCVLEASAARFIADAEIGTDLARGATSSWPHAAGAGGGTVDLRAVPGPRSGVQRFGYLTGFDRGRASVTNARLGVRATLEWDERVFPHAWLWIEAAASSGYPWFRSAYVMGLEPAASYPGHGIEAARAAGTLVPFEPGEARTATVALTVARA